MFHVCFGKNGEPWFDILPNQIDDSTPIYSGLFNEVISSCLVRYLPSQIKEDNGEESKEEEVKDDDPNQTKTVSLPQGLDETLLQTMTEVKKDQLLE